MYVAVLTVFIALGYSVSRNIKRKHYAKMLLLFYSPPVFDTEANWGKEIKENVHFQMLFKFTLENSFPKSFKFNKVEELYKL